MQLVSATNQAEKSEKGDKAGEANWTGDTARAGKAASPVGCEGRAGGTKAHILLPADATKFQAPEYLKG
jgi:hypothetical protein